MDKHNRQMGIGQVVIPDSSSEVLVTLTALKEFIDTPDIVEATATLCVVLFSRELEFDKIALKGDALQVIQALRKKGQN